MGLLGDLLDCDAAFNPTTDPRYYVVINSFLKAVIYLKTDDGDLAARKADAVFAIASVRPFCNMRDSRPTLPEGTSALV